jgi:hypothetical protein
MSYGSFFQVLAVNLLLVNNLRPVEVLKLTPATIDLEALCGLASHLVPYCHGEMSFHCTRCALF